MPNPTRRQMLAGLGTSMVALPSHAEQPRAAHPWRILVIGGHPGDPEAGCGGTMALYARAGHDVTALYLNRGQAGVSGKTAREAAEIRSAEAAAACRILGAKPLFAGQIDAESEVNPHRSQEFSKLVAGINPDVIFTQWPIDHHPDHRACAILSEAAWIALGRKCSLYFYEVDLGKDTQCFHPSHFVDVSTVEPLKRDACMAHRSQNPAGFYNEDHVPMMRFRGMESGCKYAEAFVHHEQSAPGRLPV
ncbi:MAG TPA: PIG-L deacetylase family protein [Tepidisphaeraceae bacterium]|nr:PIG-L deacetylase family protein [Tepidisphaeraceae bacterium]